VGSLDSAGIQIPPSDEWDAAYQRVENYLRALQIRNRPVLNHLVQQILERSLGRIRDGETRTPLEVAGEEMMHELERWMRLATPVEADMSENAVLLRGRMALLMSRLSPERQALILTEPIEDEVFHEEMQRAYNLAGPNFKHLTMKPRPLDYGVPGWAASHALRGLARVPLLRLILAWGILFSLFAAIFYYTR
jgi:hypothetical protein